MTIGQVARKAGVTQSAIRYYEASGLLARPSRKHGARQYNDDAVDQVKVLRFFRRAGISIRGLATMTSKDYEPNTRRDVVLGVIQRRIADLDALVIEVQETKKRLEESIACECNGDLKACPILPPDEDAAIL